MTSTSLLQPVTESLEITLLMATHYPSLLPEQYRPLIIRLLSELHAIQPLSLSAPPLEAHNQHIGLANVKIDEHLREDISFNWRKALEFKRSL
jgi:hypothetical protein